jgi:DNA-binding transcriptional ArsR family regulator
MAKHAEQLTALADPTRRRIFELVGERPRPVVEIARELPVSQSAVSQHLKVLREAGLVRAVPKGASNVYHIDPHGLGAMRVWLDRFWDLALEQFKLEADKE